MDEIKQGAYRRRGWPSRLIGVVVVIVVSVVRIVFEEVHKIVQAELHILELVTCQGCCGQCSLLLL